MTVPELEELLTDEQRQDLQVQLARLEDQAFSQLHMLRLFSTAKSYLYNHVNE